MKEWVDKIGKRPYLRQAVFALGCTVLVFSVFVGQELFSDVVTFAKNGDQDKLCFAAFMKIRECILNGESVVGVDSGSFNGATEFFLRANIPVAYILFFLFAALAVFFNARLMYMLLYAVHMFASLYYMQKICIKHFKLTNELAMVVAALYAYLLCVEAWYLSFYIITALCVVLLYCSLEYFDTQTMKTALQLTLSVILTVVSGYITVAVFAVVFIYFISQIKLWISDQNTKIKVKTAVRFTTPYVVGGVIVLPYLIQLLLYVKEVVGSNTNLADAVFYKLNFSDLLCVFSGTAFTYQSLYEGISTIALGFISCIVIAYAIVDSVLHKMSSFERVFVLCNFVVFGFLLFWSSEDSFALTGWMYALIPVLGSMHIPGRFLMATLPTLYISIGILAQKIDWNKYKKSLSIVSMTAIITVVGYILLIRWGHPIPFAIENQFILETILLVIFVLLLLKSDGERLPKGAAVVWAFSMLLSGTTYFYNANEVYARGDVIKAHSIVYNEVAQKAIDAFIASTSNESKEMYRVVAYDSIESVPAYLISNYEWYGYSAYDLCNYSGYEIQLCVPEDYRYISPWFNTYDWEYLKNTRADYMMTDYATIDANRGFFNNVIDWDKGICDLGNSRMMVALKHFIPSTISGMTDMLDSEMVLDNGYFYSSDLQNENLIAFDTNQSTYYQAEISSDCPATIAFLPFANRNYHYYIDGCEIVPNIDRSQAFFQLDAGTHSIRVEYKNPIGTIGYYAVIISSAAIIFVVMGLKIRGKKER